MWADAVAVLANFAPPEVGASADALRFLTGSRGAGVGRAKSAADRPAPATVRAEPGVDEPGPGATGQGCE
jgi:hypothetical protein